MAIPLSSLPHDDQYVAVAGNTTNPKQALILLHGRDASADNIMRLIDGLTIPDDYLVLAPQAAGHVWYPERFIVSQAHNQPQLNSALTRIETITDWLQNKYDIESRQMILAGFSQGACLISEYLKRYPQKYKGVAIFSGGLIGDEIEVTVPVSGNLEHTPIYIGCDVADFHIPKERVTTTADILSSMDAAIDLRLYENLGHSIHQEGMAALQNFISV